MITASTFVRFTFAALFVNALAVACTVESSDGDEDCSPGATQSCDCSDGAEGTRTCNASGSGYGICVCDPGGAGGEGAGGSGAGGSGGSSSAGMDNGGGDSPVGGSDNAGGGGQANGGAAGEGGAGGVANLAGAAGSGGEGGVGATPAICLDPADACEDCYYSCCDEWVACTDDATCPDEFFDILNCTDTIKVDRDVKIEDLAACSDSVGIAGGGWSSGLTPQTIAMVNCLGGDPSSDTWSDQTVWPADSCNIGCFKQ